MITKKEKRMVAKMQNYDTQALENIKNRGAKNVRPGNTKRHKKD